MNLSQLNVLINSLYAYLIYKFHHFIKCNALLVFIFLLMMNTVGFAQLSGSYTIGGTSPDYASLTEAVNALSLNGINAPVVFNIRTGVYNEQLAIEEIVGVSSTNTITFQSETNNASDVTIQHDASSSKNYLIFLDGTDHIILDGLTFQTSSGSYNDMLLLNNGTSNISVINSVFSSSSTNGSSIYTRGNTLFENILIENNAFTGNRYGIYLSGNLIGATINNNQFTSNATSTSYYTIYSDSPDSLIISNNEISNISNGSGIHVSSCEKGLVIENNQIYNQGSGIGIQVSSSYGSATIRNKVINNVVSTAGDGVYFFYFYNADIFFNSVLTTSTDINKETMYWRYTNNMDIRNNIFANEGGGYAAYGYSATGLVLDYNNYYSTGANIGRWNGTVINNIEDWQTASTQDANSVSASPVFASTMDLHPNQALIDGAGIAIANYNTDIEGTTQDTPPDMGAYQFTASGDNAGVISILPETPFDPGSHPVTIELFNNGPSTLSTDSLYWTINNIEQIPVYWTGNLAMNTSESVALGTYQFDEITAYEIKVWSSSPNGQTDIDRSDDTLVVSNIYTTLTGDYTVGGTAPDFASLTEAQDALNYGGLRGAVNLLLSNGNYNEQIVLKELYGSSATNTITIQSETGNAADVTIQHDASSSKNYLVFLDGADHIILDGLTFQTSSSSYNDMLLLNNGTSNISVINSVFSSSRTNGSSIYARGNTLYQNIWIENNAFTGNRYGIYLSGNLIGATINNNQFTSNATSTSYYTIYSVSPDSLIISNNEISNISNGSGIHVSSCEKGLVIENNQIYNQGSGIGINVSSSYGSATIRNKVINNVVSTAGDGVYFFYFYNADIFFNSVLTTSTDINKETMYWRYTNNMDIRNNIFANEGGGYAAYGYSATGLVLDYNNYYSTGANIGRWNGTVISDFTNWEFNTQQDANSMAINPQFQSSDNLQTNNIALAVGIPINNVTEDFEGDIRNPLNPYLGADEAPTAFDDIGIVNLVSPTPPFPQGTNEIFINVANNFTSPLTNANISWSVDGDSIREVPWTGNIPSGTSKSIQAGTFQFDVAQPYDLKVWVSEPNGETDTYNLNDTLEVLDMYAALIGSYTIGLDNADFETITQAVEALERGGIVGEVTFNIQDGTYEENIEITDILGSSVVNKIIFQSENQDSALVTIKNAEATTNYIFVLDSTDNVELRHLTFEQTHNNSSCLRLANVNEHVNINYCHFKNRNTAIRVDNFVDNLNITNNSIIGGSYGFYDNSYNYSTNVAIENNSFTDQTTTAIYVRYFDSPIIQSNTIVVNGSIGTAMNLNSIRNQFKVISNTLILNDATNGIYATTNNTNATNRGLIGNNFITINGTSSTYGLNIAGSYIDLFHNNVLVTSAETSAGRAIHLSGSNHNLKNNIFTNTGGGYAIYANNTNTINSSDYNNFYAPGGRIGYWNGNRTVLANWQAGSGFDANSFNLDPEFNADTDLHINQQLLSEKGTPVTGLPEDIDGDFRNPLTPDVGADEFTSLVNNVSVDEILNPITACDLPDDDNITIVVKNNGSQTQANFNVAYQIENGTPVVETLNASIAPGFTVEHTFSTPFTLIDDSIYTIKAYTLLTTDELLFNDTLTTEVISYPALNLFVSSNATIDYGDTLSLTASGGTDYIWSGNLEGENPYSSTLTVAPFETQVYTIEASNNNGCEASKEVTITVNPLPELPDLQVSNVQSGLTSVEPGDAVTLTWNVGNTGDGFAIADWTEKIYIQTPNGANRTLIEQINYDGTDTLNVGAFYNRSLDIVLPGVLSIGDFGVFVVELVPNILEIPLSTINNTAIENDIWTIERKLYLEITQEELREGSGSLYCTVSRSGSTASSLTVNITPSEPSRFNYASQVTISAGQAGRTFYISAPNNTDLEGDKLIDITASATSFDSASTQIVLIDDEIPALSISNLPSVIAEGDLLNFNVSTNFPPADTLFVNIISNEVEDVPLPTPIAIPPGSTTANVQVTLPNDDFAEPDEQITITAGSAGLTAASENFTLTNDEDIPAISFALTIDTISEAAGLYATQGIITRLGNTGAVLQVDISSSSPAELYMPSTVPLGPGEMEKSFYIGIFDNQQNEGFRDIEITASVLIAACNCTAASSSEGVYSDILTVADNDGASLSLTVNPFSLAEGLSNAGTLTVERNTATTNALNVSLNSSDVSELVLPATVTIPAGSASVNVAIATQADGTVDGNQTVTIQANATNFSPGIIQVIVTDNNKPDFQITAVDVPETTVGALSPFTFRAFIINTGFATAPSGAVLNGFLSEDNILSEDDIEVGNYVTYDPIAVGDTLEFWDVALSPYEAGLYHLLFEINPDNNLTEIQYLNNTSPAVEIEIEPDYTGTAIVDNLTYLQGETIAIHGQSSKPDGSPFPNAELEVYIIVDNIRREISVTTDENGAYTTSFEPLVTEAGHYIIGASFPDEGLTVAQDEFDILGFEINANQFLLWEVLLDEPETGTVAIRNRSNVPLNNVTVEAIDLPSGISLVFDEIPVLQGNETINLNYTLTGTEVSPIGNYQELELVVSCDENATNDLTAYYFCQAQQGYISANISSINRTISQEQSNFLEFEIYNNGEGETGDISVNLPPVDFMNLVSLQTIPSVASGDTALVIIEFIPAASLPLNTPATGTIVLDASNGNFITIPYRVEKVSDQTGGIIVDVIDEYTYFTDEAPHVENALVRISHYFTGQVFAEGYTNADGIFTADNLPEGQLRITVQADQHEGYDNVINILPGTDIEETIFISYQAISFTWDVVPTTIEDSYQIDLVMEFETNVPMPVVTIETPDTMPQLFGNETFNFYATLTNHGLITANDVQLNLPTNDVEYEFVTNYTSADLLAQQAIQIPIVMQRRGAGVFKSGDMDNIGEVSKFLGMQKESYEAIENMRLTGSCSGFVSAVCSYECAGRSLQSTGGKSITYGGRECGGGVGSQTNINTTTTYNPCPGCPGIGSSGPINNIPLVSVKDDCDGGCTDPCAPNFDASAETDDGSCQPYDRSCNQDCNLGPFGGTWDSTKCMCVNEKTPIPGCMNIFSCNYNPSANCDDDSCLPLDDNCNQDCNLGPFGGTWDNEECICINEKTPIPGCMNIFSCNYNPSANCDDDSCDDEPDPFDNCFYTIDIFDEETCEIINIPNCPDNTIFNKNLCSCDEEIIEGCTDPCAVNYYSPANTDDGSCEPYDSNCNQDCTAGSFGGSWDTATCRCINEITPVRGCTDDNACNYNPSANCDNGNCDYGYTACISPCSPPPDPDDGCDITIDSFNEATCTVTNIPNCPANATFKASTCKCESGPDLADCAYNLGLAVAGCSPIPIVSNTACILSFLGSSNEGEVSIAILGCIPYGNFGCAVGAANATVICYEAGENTGARYAVKSGSNNFSPIIDDALENMFQAQLGLEAQLAWIQEFFGPISSNENILNFAIVFNENTIDDQAISISQANKIKSEMQGFDISEAEIDTFIQRWNQTLEAWNNGITKPNNVYPNIANQDSMTAYIAQIQSSEEYAINKGYESIGDMLYSSVEIILEEEDEESAGVCASVTLNISQELTMTREAFEGTLGVVNGHPTDAIDSLSLNLEILNPQGVLSNDLFQIEVQSLNELTGVEGTGMLNSQSEGSATILFIPESGAAPTVPISYSFGGSVSYLDPFSGLMVTVPLIPATLQVNPSPDLYLHYFMQRDIYGDDPLTDAIEPIIPGELAVMIENNGYGEAMSVLIESAQPEIVDNEKGLAINFNLIGSNLQGEPTNLGLNNITFGDIPPQSTRLGQWYFTSSLLGHFINYETNLVHLSSYGNPDLSLISGVELHESIHTIEVYTQEDGLDDFLVNEIQDAYETPDAIYLSQGNLIYDVFEAETANFTGDILAAGNTNTLSVDPSELGWNYIKLDDPGNGNFELVSVTRSDGQAIPLKNVWLSHVTLPDSKEPIYENKFHIVDDFDGFSAVSYTVVWSPKDPNPPTVVSISGQPEQATSEQVENLTVTFSEAIIESSFGIEDLMLSLQGGTNIIDNTISIAQIDSVTYTIDLSNVTISNGYYVLTVQAAGVQDLTGTFGEVGEQAMWTQFLSVPSIQTFTGLPENNTGNQLNSIQVQFNLPLEVSTFTTDDVQILLDGTAQTGNLSITSLNAENTLFELSGLSSFMNADGSYELVFDLTGIQSSDGTAGLATQTENFVLDTKAPQLVNLLRYIGGGLDQQHYTGADLNFDEDIMPFELSAIALLKDGVAQVLNSAIVDVMQVNPSWFAVDNFGQLTYPEGDYIMEVDMAEIYDLAGNAGTGTESISWSVDRTANLVISGLSIAPDMGHSPSDGITASRDLTLSFGINESAELIEVYQNDNGTLTLMETLNAVPAGAVDIPFLLETGGNTALEIRLTDTEGNGITEQMDIYIDESALTANWNFEEGQTLSAHPASINFTLSDQLLDISEIQNALIVLFDNNILDASSVTITSAPNSITEFEVSGLQSLSNAPGNYTLGVDLTRLNKYSSGIAGTDFSYVSWALEDSDNTTPVAIAGTDTTLTSTGTFMLDAGNSFDPDGDELTYQWYAPEGVSGVLLDDESLATPSFTINEATHGSQLSFLLSVSDGNLFATDIVEITINLQSCELSAEDCNDNNSCTADTIDELTCECVHETIPDCELEYNCAEDESMSGMDICVDQDINMFFNADDNQFQIGGLLNEYTIEILNEDGSLYESIDADGNYHAIDLNAMPFATYLISVQHKERAEVVLQSIIKTNNCNIVDADICLDEYINLGYNAVDEIFKIAGMLDNYTIQILDEDGVVYETINATSYFHTIDLTELPDGLFFIFLQNKEVESEAYITIIKN